MNPNHESIARRLKESRDLLRDLETAHADAWNEDEREAVADAIRNAGDALRSLPAASDDIPAPPQITRAVRKLNLPYFDPQEPGMEP